MINKIGLILGFLGLILSFYWGYMYYKNKAELRELLAKSEQTLSEIEEDSKARQDSILNESIRKDSTIKVLSEGQKMTKEALNQAFLQGRSLVIAQKKAKAERDTVTYYAKCDSLADHVAVVEAQNEVYQGKVDALNLAFRMQLANKDSLLVEKDRLYGKLRESFTGATLKINQLGEENKKLDMKLDKSKRATRVAILVGALAAGAVYITSR